MLQPAVDRVRANLDALRATAERPVETGADAEVRTAEDLIDAAEAWAARRADARFRSQLLTATLLLRRIDQSVVTLAGAPVTPAGPQVSRR